MSLLLNVAGAVVASVTVHGRNMGFRAGYTGTAWERERYSGCEATEWVSNSVV
jgi:hypothetical protein